MFIIIIKQDVVVDLVSYRRNGHNEIDEPMFTQPLMYKKIRGMRNVLEKYSARLLEEGVVTKEEVDDVRNKYEKICEEAYGKAQKETQIRYKDWLDSPWSGFFEGNFPFMLAVLRRKSVFIFFFKFRKRSFENVDHWHQGRNFDAYWQAIFQSSAQCCWICRP